MNNQIEAKQQYDVLKQNIQAQISEWESFLREAQTEPQADSDYFHLLSQMANELVQLHEIYKKWNDNLLTEALKKNLADLAKKVEAVNKLQDEVQYYRIFHLNFPRWEEEIEQLVETAKTELPRWEELFTVFKSIQCDVSDLNIARLDESFADLDKIQYVDTIIGDYTLHEFEELCTDLAMANDAYCDDDIEVLFNKIKASSGMFFLIQMKALQQVFFEFNTEVESLLQRLNDFSQVIRSGELRYEVENLAPVFNLQFHLPFALLNKHFLSIYQKSFRVIGILYENEYLLYQKHIQMCYCNVSLLNSKIIANQMKQQLEKVINKNPELHSDLQEWYDDVSQSVVELKDLPEACNKLYNSSIYNVLKNMEKSYKEEDYSSYVFCIKSLCKSFEIDERVNQCFHMSDFVEKDELLSQLLPEKDNLHT